MKRKNTSDESAVSKRARPDSSTDKAQNTTQSGIASSAQRGESSLRSKEAGKTRGTATAPSKLISPPSKRRETIRKLAPPRPFPNVPSSVSASGPKSTHKEGKNLICISRRTPLAAYLRRCKKLLIEDGYQVLHLHAMGAAIPHLLTLSVSLPQILPFTKDEIQLEVRTGTIEVVDEVMPEDDDEDISMRTRGKGGVSVMLKLGDRRSITSGARPAKGVTTSEEKKKQIIVVQEQEQEENADMEEDEGNTNRAVDTGV
ncbi:hypothetical protein K439DRAFT_1627782 [Ramaria rubella]|nr:hypothetical protein K439DRAFT_1627782 [Ramaria rubella]